MLGDSYFSGPAYFIINAWIRTTFLFPSFINLISTNICVYDKSFPGVVWYLAPGILSWSTVAVVDVAPPFVRTVSISQLYFLSCYHNTLGSGIGVVSVILHVRTFFYIYHCFFTLFCLLKRYTTLCGQWVSCMPCHYACLSFCSTMFPPACFFMKSVVCVMQIVHCHKFAFCSTVSLKVLISSLLYHYACVFMWYVFVWANG